MIEMMIFFKFKMELNEVLEILKDIALYIAIAIYLIFKILKHFISREHLKLKKDSLSVFNSIESSPSLSAKPLGASATYKVEKDDK